MVPGAMVAVMPVSGATNASKYSVPIWDEEMPAPGAIQACV